MKSTILNMRQLGRYFRCDPDLLSGLLTKIGVPLASRDGQLVADVGIATAMLRAEGYLPEDNAPPRRNAPAIGFDGAADAEADDDVSDEDDLDGEESETDEAETNDESTTRRGHRARRSRR